jgi:hypothetical protein
MLQRHLFRLSSAILLSSLLTCAQAVELGDTLVRSHLGQPLSADIELTAIADDATAVQAGLASADVYRGAGTAMHPALSSLNITIVRREGRRFLHIVSPKAVESEFINIFFELTENGRRSVRQTTLWFTPDPNPAPPPLVVAAVLPAAPLKAPSIAAAPLRPIPAPVIAPLFQPRPVALPAARPAACVQQFTAAQIGTCAAIDAKNAALRAQITELEEKVQRLAGVMRAAAEPVASPRPAPKSAPARLTPMKPMGAPAAPTSGTTPWLFIGIASVVVFALVGALLFLLRRKRKGAKRTPAVASGAGLIASVKNRLMPARKPEPEAPMEAEPSAG